MSSSRDGGTEREPTRVAVLGPVGVTVGAQFSAPPSPVSRTLLAALALAPGNELSSPALRAVLWDDPPSRSALPVAIHRLRSWLDEHAPRVRLERSPVGYRLMDGESDAARFRELVEAARTLHPVEKSRVLEQALALWRGRALEDVRTDLGAEQLERERRSAVTEFADALVTTASADRAVALLRPEAASHPLDEHLQRALIRSLDAAGDADEAVRVYQELRHRLVEELGVEPAATVQHAYLGVIRNQLALDDGGTGSGPRPLRFPADRTTYVGRDDALLELDTILADSATRSAPMVATIGGIAGIGKTALGVRWAHRVSDRFPDGMFYLDLRGYSGAVPMTRSEALGHLLRALGVPAHDVPSDEDEAAAELRTLTADSRVLVMLDNAQHPEQVRPLLPSGVDCCALITSRARLTDLQVHLGADAVDLELLPSGEAIELLATVSGRGSGVTGSAAVELAALCDHLPLALHVAGGDLRHRTELTVADYVAELRSGERPAETGISGRPGDAVRTAFDASYHRLGDAAQQVFRWLGLIPGSALPLAAIATLTGSSHRETGAALASLVEAHLVDQLAVDRFTLHDLLGTYARTLLEETEREAARTAATHRISTWYGDRLTSAVRLVDADVPLVSEPGHPPVFTERGRALGWLDAEHGTVLDLVEHAGALGLAETVWTLAIATIPYLRLRGRTLERLVLAKAARAATGDHGAHAPPRVRALAELVFAEVCLDLSRYDEAMQACARAKSLSEKASWPYGAAAAVTVRSVVQGQTGEAVRGLKSIEQAIEMSRANDFVALRGRQLNNLGIGLLWHGILDRARDCFAEAERIHRLTGAVADEVTSTNSLAQLALEAGDLDGAVSHLATASETVRREGEAPEWPRVLNTLAAVHCAAGRYQEAYDACQTALPLAERTANRVVQASILNNLGEAALHLDHRDESRDAHRRALDLAMRTRLLRHRSGALLGLARYHRAAGELDDAARYAADAVASGGESGRTWLEGQALTELAAVELARGDRASAAAHASTALRIHERAGHRLCAARAEELMAGLGVG